MCKLVSLQWNMVGFINNFVQNKKMYQKRENKHVGGWRKKKVVFVFKK